MATKITCIMKRYNYYYGVFGYPILSFGIGFPNTTYISYKFYFGLRFKGNILAFTFGVNMNFTANTEHEVELGLDSNKFNIFDLI